MGSTVKRVADQRDLLSSLNSQVGTFEKIFNDAATLTKETRADITKVQDEILILQESFVYLKTRMLGPEKLG